MFLIKYIIFFVGFCFVVVFVFCEEGVLLKKVDIYMIVFLLGDCEKKVKEGNVVQVYFKGILENGIEFFNR